MVKEALGLHAKLFSSYRRYVLKLQGQRAHKPWTAGFNHYPLLNRALIRWKLEHEVMNYNVVYLVWGQRVSESDPGGLLRLLEIVRWPPWLCRCSTLIWGSPGILEGCVDFNCISWALDNIFHLPTGQPHRPFYTVMAVALSYCPSDTYCLAHTCWSTVDPQL